MLLKSVIAMAAWAVSVVASPAFAQVKIGVVTSSTGPTALVGIPHKNTVPLLPTKIGDLSVEALISANPMFSADADFFPGQRSTWGLTFLINESVSPQGRPAGSLAWAGLANSFYWIDKVNRVCGVWATQLLPFFDPAAIAGFRAFETALYANL